MAELRKIQEQYRQPFGEQYTQPYGRPIGWAMFLAAFEKVAFPTSLMIMLILRMWEPLAVTLVAELVVSLTVLFVVSRGARIATVLKGIAITPLRYGLMVADTVTMPALRDRPVDHGEPEMAQVSRAIPLRRPRGWLAALPALASRRTRPSTRWTPAGPAAMARR